MFALKLILATAFVVASARPWAEEIQDQAYFLGFDEEGNPVLMEEEDIPALKVAAYLGHLTRSRRQAQGSVTLDSDGGIGLSGKVPLTGNNHNKLSAIGSVDLNDHMNPTSKAIGLTLDNSKGHSLTVLKQNIDGYGDRITGAGKLNVLQTPDHRVDLRDSVSRTMPDSPYIPNHNTYGAGVDYMFKEKVGGSLGIAKTPLFDRTDYSAMGNVNLFKNPTTSLDFSGGVRKFEVPSFSSRWEPNFGFTFSKSIPNW